MFNKFLKHRFFVFLLLSYIVILLFPIFFETFIYSKTINIIEDKEMKSNMSILQQSMQDFSEHISFMKMIVNQQISDNYVQDILTNSDPNKVKNTYYIYNIINHLKNYTTEDNFILSYYILCNQGDIVLAPNMIASYSQFYDLFFHYTNLSYNNWYDQIKGGSYCETIIPAQNAIYYNKNISVITYTQTLDLPNDTIGRVMILVSNDEVKNLLSKINISGGGWAYITDSKMQIISSITSKGGKLSVVPIENTQSGNGFFYKKINGINMLITYVSTADNQYRFVAVQPVQTILASAYSIRNLILLVNILILLLGIAVSYLLAHRNTAPVKEIISGLIGISCKDTENKGEFSFIKVAISDLMNDNDSLNEAIKTQILILRASAIGRLLRGEFFSEDELNSLIHYVGIDSNSKSYLAVLISFNQSIVEPGDEMEFIISKEKSIILQLFSDITNGLIHQYDIASNKTAILLSFLEVDVETCKSAFIGYVRKLEEDLPPEYLNGIWFGVGGIYNDFGNISKSFKEAMIAIDCRTWNRKGKIIWYSDAVPNIKSYYYPDYVENKLIALVKSGNNKESVQLLNEVYTENIDKRELSVNQINVLYSDIIATIYKILAQTFIEAGIRNEIGRKFENINNLNDYKKIKELENIISSLSNYINQQKKSHNTELKNNILKYVGKHYSDSDLSLTLIGQQFNLSATYLSMFFKEQNGENFLSYLENMRIQNARKLLNETNLSVNEIAAQVGYFSINSFCRSFKKINGVSATKFRQC
jgi:two-component system response regulator YesN